MILGAPKTDLTIFDLIFIAVALTSVGLLSITVFLWLIGRRTHSLVILRGFTIGIAIYFGIVLIVSVVTSRQRIGMGNPLCFDDWCITVEGVTQSISSSDPFYLVDLRLSSQARRASQRENGVVVYLIDAMGNRYDAIPDASAVPLNVLLQPGKAIHTTLTIRVPPDRHISGVVIAHEGGFPIDWFIIGHGPFQKPPIVYLDE